MRCAVTFEKIVKHGTKHLNIWNGFTAYPDYAFYSSTTRLTASVITLPVGTYTLSADAEGVTCKVYTYTGSTAAGVLPASGEGEMPYTFTLPEARKISIDFAYEGWGDTEIAPGAVTNAVVCAGEGTSTDDVWETIALHPQELADSDTIAQAVNSKMAVTLKILPSFELWQFCEKSVTYVRIIDLDRDSDRVIFRGRVSAITDNMEESGALYQDVTCVSALDFFEDTSLFWEDGTGYLVNPTVPTYGLIPYQMITYHNTDVDNFRKFAYTISGNAYYAKGGTVYGSRYSVLSSMLTSGDLRKYAGGGVIAGNYTMEFRENFAGDVNTLEIAEKFGQYVDTAILIGDNLRSIRIEKALQDAVYTRICAVSGVNSDGGRYFTYATNDEMYAKYGGGRELVITNDSIRCTAPMYENEEEYGTQVKTEAYLAMIETLEVYAEQEAANLSEMPIKLTISAVDLAEMGYSGYEPFEVGNSYPVICPPLGLNGKPMRITSIKRRLCDGKIEQITIESGKKVVKSSSSLSAMMARLEELNRRVSDGAEEQTEIAQTIVEEQTGGVKTRPMPRFMYGIITHNTDSVYLVSDEDGRTDMYVGDYLVGGSGGYSIAGMTKAQYDALTTYSNTTIYIVDNSGTIEMYVGTQRITSQGGGGATIETAAVLTSEQMQTWAPQHALVPVEFRGSAMVYYAQAPARVVIQGQRALFGVNDGMVSGDDIMSEVIYDYPDGARQKIKAFIREMTATSVSIAAAYYDVSGAAETRLGYTTNYRINIPYGWQSLKVGIAIHVQNYYLNENDEFAANIQAKLYIFINGSLGAAGQLIGAKYSGGQVTTVGIEFGSAAERGFASGISRRTEPAYPNSVEEGDSE